MKTIKCSDTGPDIVCDHTVTAETVDEAIAAFGKHAIEAHGDMMERATESDKVHWEKNFKDNVWSNTKDD